jgi:ABC-type Zn uptake system ZnuABC Zn-binding protein ZnuA
MSIHISNKIISDKNIIVVIVISLALAFIFISLLILYFPRNYNFNVDNINDPNVFKNIKKKEVSVTSGAILNIARILAKGTTVNIADLNQDQNFKNEKSFIGAVQSVGLVVESSDQIDSESRVNLENQGVIILDLSKNIDLKKKSPSINLDFGDVLASSSSITLQESVLDYSYLFNNKNLKNTIEEITIVLIKIDPDRADTFKSNSVDLLSEIETVLNQGKGFENCKVKNILTNTENLGYLDSLYDFEITVFSNFDPLNPSINQAKFIKSLAESKKVNSIFINKKIPLVDLENLKKILGLDVFYVDYYSSPDIVETLKNNLKIIKTAQDC